MNTSLEQYLRNSHSEQTAQNYIYEITNFKNMFPTHCWLQYQDIIQFLDFLQTKYENKSTRTRILSAIKRYYDYLIEIGVRSDHPCKTIVIKSKRNKTIQTQNLFSRDELLFLFNRDNRYEFLEVRNKLITSFLIYQALMSEEIIRLTLDDIDFDNGTVYIKRGSKQRNRLLALHISQHNLLYSYIHKYRPQLITSKCSTLILNKRGNPITVNGIYAIFDQFKHVYPERNLSPLTIRQSTISYWLNEKKYPLEDVQDLAGHRYPSATQAYKSIDIDESRKWINTFHPIR